MKFTIIELGINDFEKTEMVNELIDNTFPEYKPTKIKKRLNLYHGLYFPKVKLFYIENETKPVAFAQMIYKMWGNKLVCDLDLLGSIHSERRKGYAEALFYHCRDDFTEETTRYELQPVGLMTLIDPNYNSIVRLHEKSGGQLRRDITNNFGEIVVWYPSNNENSKLKTDELLGQMNEFGNLISSFI